MAYGKELILDLHNCNVGMFNRSTLDLFFASLCKAIDMQQCERYFWDDVGVPEEERQTSPHTKGTSAIQFILTSNITIHTLDELEAVYINIFSCKDFDSDIAAFTCINWFNGIIVNRIEVDRL